MRNEKILKLIFFYGNFTWNPISTIYDILCYVYEKKSKRTSGERTQRRKK